MQLEQLERGLEMLRTSTSVTLALALLALALHGCLPDTDLEPPESRDTGDELIIDSDGSFVGERPLEDDDDLLLIDSDGRIDRDDPY